jgi:hypothetical protein
MKRQVEYHPEATKEIHEAVNWYNFRNQGLGTEFLIELKSAELRIAGNPEVWPYYEGNTRRYLLKKFPFSIIYSIYKDKIQIIAIAHCKRKPAYWRKRL